MEKLVVFLNVPDGTHPNLGTAARLYTVDPGMLLRRERTTMRWSSRHERVCLPPLQGVQGATGMANRPRGWVRASARVLVIAGGAAPDEYRPAPPRPASHTTGVPGRRHPCEGAGAGNSGATCDYGVIVRIPRESCHPFHGKVATDSIVNLPLIPRQSCHPSREPSATQGITHRYREPFSPHEGDSGATQEVIDASSSRSVTSQMGGWAQ